MYKYNMLNIVIFSFIIICVGADVIQVHPCPHAAERGDVLPVSVDITPCSAFPCKFKRGDSADVKIEFAATDDHTNLTAAIYGIILGTEVKFTMPNSNACVNSGIACPVTKGKTYTYHAKFDVLPVYPQISVVVEWKIDGSGPNGKKNDFCMTFPVQIQ